MDVRRLEHLAGRQVVHLHVRAVTHRCILRVVQLDNVKVVGIRTAGAFAATPRHVGRTVVIDKDARVKAPGNAIAADNAAATHQFVLALAHGVCPRAVNCRGLDVTNATATAIGEHNVERTVMHRDAGRPDVVNAVHLACIVNNAVIGPVLHILAAECIEGVNLVAIGICGRRVVGVRNDVEVFIVGSGTGVSQVMISRNRVVGKTKHGKARHKASCSFKGRSFPHFFVIHKSTPEKAKHSKPSI